MGTELNVELAGAQVGEVKSGCAHNRPFSSLGLVDGGQQDMANGMRTPRCTVRRVIASIADPSDGVLYPVTIHRNVRAPQRVKVEVAMMASDAGQEDGDLIETVDEALVFQSPQHVRQLDGLIASIHSDNG